MADVSVRPARPGDAGEIARIQLETWRIAYADLLPAPVLAGLSEEAARASWTAAVSEPPPRSHVLLAQEQQWTVGFVALAPLDNAEENEPAPDSTVALGPLLVEPRWGRRGHGSRLLAAAVDTAREDGMTRAVAWVPEGDQVSRAFYRSAGWAEDGLVRALDTGAGELREVRLHVWLDR